MTIKRLDGRALLLVEDDFLQAREMAVFLKREGAHVVGPTARAIDVPVLLNCQPVDAAIVDVNLGSGAGYETAELLIEKGVPFAFLTGFDPSAIPSKFAHVPCLNKPACERIVTETLFQLLAESGS